MNAVPVERVRSSGEERDAGKSVRDDFLAAQPRLQVVAIAPDRTTDSRPSHSASTVILRRPTSPPSRGAEAAMTVCCVQNDRRRYVRQIPGEDRIPQIPAGRTDTDESGAACLLRGGEPPQGPAI